MSGGNQASDPFCKKVLTRAVAATTTACWRLSATQCAKLATKQVLRGSNELHGPRATQPLLDAFLLLRGFGGPTLTAWDPVVAGSALLFRRFCLRQGQISGKKHLGVCSLCLTLAWKSMSGSGGCLRITHNPWSSPLSTSLEYPSFLSLSLPAQHRSRKTPSQIGCC